MLFIKLNVLKKPVAQVIKLGNCPTPLKSEGRTPILNEKIYNKTTKTLISN